MRLLIVSPEPVAPLDRGFRIRVHQLAAGLARRDHAVTVLAPANPAPVTNDLDPSADVEVITSSARDRRPTRARRALEVIRGRSAGWLDRRRPGLLNAARGLLARRAFDAVQIEIPELVGIDASTDLPIVLDSHNVWAELIERRGPYDDSRARRALRRIESAAYGRAERDAWRRSARVLTTSDREASIIAVTNGTAPLVVPNGVDTEFFRPAGPAVPAAGPDLLFVGLLGYGPNADAVRHLVRDIMPLVWRDRPDATVEIVGGAAPRDVAALAEERVTLTGRVADLRPHLLRAGLVVIPLRIGSGTRLKVLEAMAMGRAVVSTTIGAEGIDAKAGEHLLIADDPADFSAAVLRLLREPELGAAIGCRARERVVEAYDWSRITEGLDAAYRALLSERNGSRE